MENRPIFDPYMMGPYNPQNIPPNMQPGPNVNGNPFLGLELSPKEFYENQYFYYRYLNELMDYKIKSKEFERLSSVNNSGRQLEQK